MNITRKHEETENPSNSRAGKIAAIPPFIRRAKNRIDHPENIQL